MTKTITNRHFTGERALFKCSDVHLVDCLLNDGESHIKESRDVTATNCRFGWKYPLWYGNNLTVEGGTLLPEARAAIWYSTNIKFSNVKILAPKAFHSKGFSFYHTRHCQSQCICVLPAWQQ